MHIEINDKTVLKDIQKTFSDYYPFLSLSFYKSPHKKYEASNVFDTIDTNSKVGEIRKTHISTLIDLQPKNTVAQVEKEFQERIGISVQILKKENNHWEQSTGLDNLTLKDLNIMGRNASDEFVIEDEDEEFETEEEI